MADLRRAMRTAADGILAVLFPSPCLLCDSLIGSPLDGPVCAACWHTLPLLREPICLRCGEPLASWRTPAAGEASPCARCQPVWRFLDGARSLGPYDGPLRDLLHHLKYNGRRSLGAKLGAALANRYTVDPLLGDRDLVVPVPLHRRRLRSRGFNQAELIARGFAGDRQSAPVVNALRRLRDTRSQTGLEAAERRANVRGAFTARSRTPLTDRTVLLVDDVLTTGSTLEACARALKEAGAARVYAVTVARVLLRPV